MMKTIRVCSILLLLALLMTGCTKTFDGYYYDIEDARAFEKDIYRECDHLFTVSYEDGMLDFVLQEQTLYIVQYVTRNEETQYHLKNTAKYTIGMELSGGQAYIWSQSTKFAAHPYKWCIVEKEFNESHDNAKAFEFTYQEKTYHLCYEIIDE